jgi:hypothetical protein
MMRSEPRTAVKLQLAVSTSAWDGFLPLFTRDVSRGGAFFTYAERVVPTSGMRCTVKVGAASVEATVAHVMTARLATATGGEPGFGVAFTTPLAAE